MRDRIEGVLELAPRSLHLFEQLHVLDGARQLASERVGAIEFPTVFLRMNGLGLHAVLGSDGAKVFCRQKQFLVGVAGRDVARHTHAERIGKRILDHAVDLGAGEVDRARCEVHLGVRQHGLAERRTPGDDLVLSLALERLSARGGWGEVVKQVFLPVEKVYKVQNGKKVMRERNYYPGYVMIEVLENKLSDDLREAIKNTTNVIHFLGKDNPIALRKAEVNKMLGKMDEMAEAGGISMSEPFIVGETIKIIEGPFNDFNGVIEDVNDEKKKLKVTVKIFGRSTPVELNYMQVEKIS